MSKPKKNPAAQKKKIKQLQNRLKSALKRIHKLKQRNRALQRIKSPPRTFKYRPRIVRTLEVKTFHRFPNHPFKIHLRPPPRPLTLKPRNSKPLHFNTHFQIRLKSQPCPLIIKPPELKEFHYFPYLPFEIRVPIWKLAIDAAPARDVILRIDPLEYTCPTTRTWAQMSSSTTIPALLQTCHLSRILALERWVLSMAAYEGGVRKVYIDVENDSIFMPSLTALWHWQEKGDEREVGRIASGMKVFVMHNGSMRNWSDYEIVHVDDGPSYSDDGADDF